MDENKKAKSPLDSALSPKGAASFRDDSETPQVKKTEGAPVLFSRGKRLESFFTEGSGLYLSQAERELLREGVSLNRPGNSLDSLNFRIVKRYMKYRPTKKKDRLAEVYLKKMNALGEEMEAIRFETHVFWEKLSPAKVWNFSLIGAILAGMFSMSLIYRYLGPGALADDDKKVSQVREERVISPEKSYPQTKVLGAEEEKELIKEGIYFESVLNDMIENKKEESENKIREMVKGYPIEEMVPYIAEKDPIVAAFLVSIARKESLWGRRVPVLNGQDCYNYWGYRGIRKLMGTGGHTCFNSRKDAVDTVAKRIEFLVSNKKLDTPAKMVIWKCGSDCEATGGQAAANKWIADVNHYFKKLNDV